MPLLGLLHKNDCSPRVLKLSLDVTDEATVDAAVKAVQETFGRFELARVELGGATKVCEGSIVFARLLT